jgi:non-specific serine/threonine protein kinase/serine/threonine-protein kinase
MTNEELPGTNSRLPDPDVSGDDHPSQIGPYRILDTLGEGGMSVVYLAEQSEPVKRRVALKILKAGMDSKQVVARFESERQALAVLDHPNVAKIFDGGIAESGRPYFVMEQVKGVPITEYCDDHRLDNEERLKVFITVCSAVQHAHLKGLIHRDLKPSNILVGVVDGKPQPKIIDFGIAKATTTTLTEATLHTRVGQIIGTPQYMSPEQANLTGLDIDTRTDIYSLGVVLYELLVGIVPLDLRAIGDQAMQVALREKDPPRPSTRITDLGDTREEVAKVRGTDPDRLQQQLKGDLDWIVMRAIEKDRTRRYETVNSLAMDCRRFLRHEPVLARPPSTAYYMQRFVRRNRLAVAAGTIAILAVIAGATAATLGYVRATEAEQIARQESATSKKVVEFLVGLFQVSNPWGAGGAPGGDITAREILDRGAGNAITELSGQPRVQATLLQAMGQVYSGLGLNDDAESMMQQALSTRRSLLGDDHPEIADTLHGLAFVDYGRGDFAEAEEKLRATIEIMQSVEGAESLEAALAMNLMSIAVANLDRLEEALAIQTEAIRILELNDDVHFLDVSYGYNNLGYVLMRLDRYTEAIEPFERAIPYTEGTNAIGQHSRVVSNLAAVHQVLGNIDEARKLNEQALELKREWFDPGHSEIAYSLNNLGWLAREQGDYEYAIELYEEAVEVFISALGEDHGNVAIVRGNLARTYAESGQPGRAVDLYGKALAGIERAAGEASSSTLPIHVGLGRSYKALGDSNRALAHFQNAFDIGSAINPDGWNTGIALSEIAALDNAALSDKERDVAFERALEIVVAAAGESNMDQAGILMLYSQHLENTDRIEMARSMYSDALAIELEKLGADDPKFVEHQFEFERRFGAEFEH